MKAGSCRYNITIGYRHTSSRHPLLLHKTVNTDLYRLLKPLDELIVPILGQACVRYPGVALGTCPQSIITDQITDHYEPYCYELGYAVCNDIRVLAVIRCISREPIPPRCAIILTTHDVTHWSVSRFLFMAIWGYILWYTINANTYGKNVACFTSSDMSQMMCKSIMNALI